MIRYYHIRHKDENGVVQAKGGMTIAYDAETRNIGVAICSLKDNYWKFKGRKIAESRYILEAEKNIGVPHTHLKEIVYE